MTQRKGSRRTLEALLFAAAASGLIWALSPLFTGYPEPWDADGLYYVTALAVAGLISGAVTPRPLWAHYLGAVIGQLAYQIAFVGIDPLLVLGAAFLLAYSLIFLFSTALASFVRLRWGGQPPPAV